MSRASVRDLHIRTSELVREAAAGALIVIERRGEPVAELRPLTKKRAAGFPNMRRFWTKFPRIPDDSGRLVAQDRDR